MVGDVNLFFNDLDDPTVAEVEIMIAEPSCRRKGLAVEALKLFLYYGATHHGVTRFYAKIGEANEASIAMFKVGGRQEATRQLFAAPVPLTTAPPTRSTPKAKLGFKQCGYAACFKEVELEWIPPAAMVKPSEWDRIVAFAGDNEGEDAAVIAQIPPPPPPLAEASAAKPKVTGSVVAAPEGKVGVSTFEGVAGDGMSAFPFEGQVMTLDQCCVVSIVERGGANLPVMGPLVMAMPTRFDPMPLSSTLLGGDVDELASAISKHLAKKTGSQVFVSCSLPDEAMEFMLSILAIVQPAVLAACGQGRGAGGAAAEEAGPKLLYRLVKRPELDQLCDESLQVKNVDASYCGVPSMDHNDGFIHLSTAKQVVSTAGLYFKGCDDLVLVS